MGDNNNDGRAFLCGVIEGFYGKPWNAAQRGTLFEWMQAWGMNTYVYAPKDDLKMRAAWRLPYDDDELAALQALQVDCAIRGIAFVYTIAPGLDVRYADDAELDVLRQKLEQVLALGVKDFCVLFDDIPFRMRPEDETRFGSFAAAQAHVANEMLAFVRGRDADGLFLFCPTEYCGRMATPSVAASAYLRELGERLHPEMDVFWTGPEIVSETIPTETIVELREVLKRRPLIWENLHANDYDIRRVHLGPFDGRPDSMRAQVRGVITNPNDEFEANYIPIRSLALYAASERYVAAEAYDALLAEWLPHFRTHGPEPITQEDLALLVDVCYLPFQHGKRGQDVLAAARRLLAAAAAGEDGDAGAPANPRDSADNDGRSVLTDLTFLQGAADTMTRLFHKLTELDDRDLMYALYPYAWELRHELAYLADYLGWVQEGRPGGRFGKPDRLPNTYRQGLVATLEGLLPMDDSGALAPRG